MEEKTKNPTTKTTNTKTAASKSTAANNGTKKDEAILKLEEENRALREQMNAILASLEKLNSNTVAAKAEESSGSKVVETPKESTINNNDAKSSVYDDIVLIHLAERMPGTTTHLQLNSGSIDLVHFGEEVTLTRQQAQEAVGKYRTWFDKYCILTVGAESAEFAKKLRLDTITNYPEFVNRDFLDKLKYCDNSELENIWHKVNDGLKTFIVSYFMNQYSEGVPEFQNVSRLQFLNALTKEGTSKQGDLENILVEIEAVAQRKNLEKKK